MNKSSAIFVSGHRDLTEDEFNKHYKMKIAKAMKLNYDFIVCDYQGADIMTLLYLTDSYYPKDKITVYHMGNHPMNCVGGIKLKCNFSNDIERDSACTNDSINDILWIRPEKEGKNSGTEQNKIRRGK